MQIDRLLYPITSLGPGKRVVIWTVGCTMKCHNCSNPELWDCNPDKDIDPSELVEIIQQTTKNVEVDGITITGGDPLEQCDELVKLLPLLSSITDDILLYTGRVYEDIRKSLSSEEQSVLLKYVSVLIDGAYIDELNDNDCPLRGSLNQRIIFIDNRKKALYTDYMTNGRTIQNVFYNDTMISVGIHNRGL